MINHTPLLIKFHNRFTLSILLVESALFNFTTPNAEFPWWSLVVHIWFHKYLYQSFDVRLEFSY